MAGGPQNNYPNQKEAPIAFILSGGGARRSVLFQIPGVGIIRPQQIKITREGKGTVYHTDQSAYLDDYGEGAGSLAVSGHTGWKAWPMSGLRAFKDIEAIFKEYLARRRKLALQTLDPNQVQLQWIDTLMDEALSVYPLQFHGDKTAGKPLLYFYTMQFVILRDLLEESSGTAADFLAGPALGAVTDALRPAMTGFPALAGHP